MIRPMNHSFSIKAAAPMPVPMHIDMTPFLAPVLFNSGKRVAICLAPKIENNVPVHPRGWPKAIAPPLGLSLSDGIFNFYTQ